MSAFNVGDRVRILTGEHRGRTAKVIQVKDSAHFDFPYEVTVRGELNPLCYRSVELERVQERNSHECGGYWVIGRKSKCEIGH